MDEDFTAEEIEEFKKAFKVFADEATGLISIKVLGKLLANLRQYPTKKDILDIVNDVDPDGEGKLDFKKFLVLMTRLVLVSDTEQEIREAFRVFDHDGKGYLNAQDLQQVMTDIGENLTDEEIDEMVRHADTNGDGRINFKEFVNIMAEPIVDARDIVRL